VFYATEPSVSGSVYSATHDISRGPQRSNESIAIMMLQLNPPLPVNTSKGRGLAHILIDYGCEQSLIWVTALENGQMWCVPNHELRAEANWTMGRPNPERKAESRPTEQLRHPKLSPSIPQSA
jgi:hypothetical protein